jgi:Holliday junction resolvase
MTIIKRNPSAGGAGAPENELPNSAQSIGLPSKKQARGGRRSRQKGDRVERELVEQHRELGIHTERYPLSGASRFRGSGHDIDIYALGREAAPFVAEVKARRDGAGFVTLEKWLGEYDALFLRRNHADAMVVLPWRTWAALLRGRV